MKNNLITDAFAKFWRFYTEEEFGGCEYVSFDKYKADTAYTMGLFYDGMEPGFTQELINSLNRFAHEIDVTTIWSNYIFPDYSEDEQFELVYHFLELPLYYCLNQPQSIRDRIIFAATHLCHQANLFIKIPSYVDDLPEDRRIGIKEFKTTIKHWNAVKTLPPSLKAIADPKYTEATYNYRNMAHHRIPPSLEYGHTNFMKRTACRERSFEYTAFENGVEVSRTKTTKYASYSLGSIPPIKATEAVLLFKKQYLLLKQAFSLYWELVEEHHCHQKGKLKIPHLN